MAFFKKKKIEIVVEAARAQRILEMLEEEGAKGYTVIPQVSGKGHRGVRNEAHVSDVFRNVLIMVIVAEDNARKIMEKTQPLLKDYAGIVFMSDAEVVRNEHF